MKRKAVWIFVLCFVVVSMIAAVIRFIPRSVTGSGIEEIVAVQANFGYGSDTCELTDIHFNREEFADCLSKYNEQRTFDKSNGFAVRDVQLRIMIRTNEGVKDIIIGTDTYTQDGDRVNYKILDADNLKKELFEICGYSEKKNTVKISFAGTIIEEKPSYLIIKPLNDKIDIDMGDKVKVVMRNGHRDFLYGLGRKVVVYFDEDYSQETEDGMKVINTDDISTEGFRDFSLEIEPSEEKKKSLILSKEDFGEISAGYDNQNADLYYYGVDKVLITIKGWTMPLEKALEQGRITLAGIVSKANQDVSSHIIEELSYDDGGSRVYKYPEYTIIKFNTIDGKRDICIGGPDLDINMVD